MIRKITHKVKKGWAELALLSAEMIIVIILFLACILAFIFIARNVFVLKNETFDYRVFTFLESYVTDKKNNFMLFITFLGSHLFLIPANVLLIVYFLFIKKHRWYSIKIPAIALSSLALMFLLKTMFGRQRPDIPLIREVHGLSFPSGHALMSVTFYGLLIFIVWETVKKAWLKWTLCILLFFLILLIGFTRIYLRVHYPSDVFAGLAMGFLWLVISIYIIRRMEKFSKRKVIQQAVET
jgi:membrane-associated phospholipid phosphatase